MTGWMFLGSLIWVPVTIGSNMWYIEFEILLFNIASFTHSFLRCDISRLRGTSLWESVYKNDESGQSIITTLS